MNILSDRKNSTGYSELIKNYASYKGPKVRADEDIEFVSSSQKYAFYHGYYHDQDTIYIQETGRKYGIWYDLEWDGDILASIKQHEVNSTDNSYTSSYDATLEYGSGGVLVAMTEFSIDRYLSAVNNGDQCTMEKMESNGEISWTAKGTKCNIVDRGIATCDVKLLDGIFAGYTLCVLTESVRDCQHGKQ